MDEKDELPGPIRTNLLEAAIEPNAPDSPKSTQGVIIPEGVANAEQELLDVSTPQAQPLIETQAKTSNSLDSLFNQTDEVLSIKETTANSEVVESTTMLADFRDDIALKNRHLLQFLWEVKRGPDFKKRHQKTIRKQDYKIQKTKGKYGRDAAKQYRAHRARLRNILHGEVIPRESDALYLLEKLISRLPTPFHGLSTETLMAIAPVVLLLSQLKGRGEHFVITDM